MSESAGRHLVFFGRHFYVWVRQNGAEAPLLAALLGASIVVVIASAYSSFLISFDSESSLIFSNDSTWKMKMWQISRTNLAFVVFVYFANIIPVKKQLKLQWRIETATSI